MSGISPNYSDWRKLAAIEVWEVAVLMHGYDPRALADVIVRDPNDPTSPYGMSPDRTWEVRMLITGIKTGELTACNSGNAFPNEHTEITRASLIPWLHKHRSGNTSAAVSGTGLPALGQDN